MKEEPKVNASENREDLAPNDPSETRFGEVDHSRRALARAGMAAPVLMTLASRPVIANGVGGGCLSGQISGNVSQQDNFVCATNSGCTPQYWKDNPTGWPTGYSAGACAEDVGGICIKWDPAAPPATSFKDVFLGDYSELFPSGYDASLMEVMQENPNSLDAHACAAVLNSATAPGDYGESVARIIEAYYMVRNGEATADWLLGILANMNTLNCGATTTCGQWRFLNDNNECKLVLGPLGP